MRFRALEIGSGDAFVIEANGKQILFDSGGSKSLIKKLLKSNRKIDLAICSHNDSDHANGFLGLLEDPEFEIDEIWLPGLWVPVLDFVIEAAINKKSVHLIFKSFEEYNEIKETNHELAYDSLVEQSDISIGDFDSKLQVISELSENDYFLSAGYNNLDWYLNESIKLDRIIKIAGLAYEKGSFIRWFKPDENEPPKDTLDHGHGLRPLNSREILKIDRLKPNNFAKLLFLTNENKYSLVFEFHHDDKPIVVFSADSDYSFLSGKTYSNNVIVTAPHHGSESNASVYGKITGDKIIWVRSDRRSRQRPGSSFKKLTHKYCLACGIKKHKEEICFKFNTKDHKWILKKALKCNCK